MIMETTIFLMKPQDMTLPLLVISGASIRPQIGRPQMGRPQITNGDSYDKQ